MSESVSALGNAVWQDGIVEIREIGPQGMITLRGDLSVSAVKKAATIAAQVAFPAQREASFAGDQGIFWMSPDEVLVLCSYDRVASNLAEMQRALGSTHGLVADVSDARAMFQLKGPHAREVMAKLAPVDLSPDAFPTGSFRRSRLAQVPAAFWMRDAQTVHIICFRSVAQYVFDLLKVAAQLGSAVDYF